MTHAEAHSGPHDIKKQIRIYVAVFLSLAVLTVVTVSVSYLHLSTGYAVALALLIASIKASLVGCYFMHLISEQKLIYWIVGGTLGAFVSMVAIILAADLTVFKI